MRWRKAAKLKLLEDKDTDGTTRAVYREMEEALGIPPVALFFPALGVYPGFLPVMWKRVRPTVVSREFFHAAERVRADAYTRVYNYFPVPDLGAVMTDLKFSPGAREELTDVVEMFHYRDPLLLLLFSLVAQAMEGPVGQARKPSSENLHATYRTAPVLIDEAIAPAPIRKIYDELRRTLQLPWVNTEYAALARWPDFLSTYWNLLTSMLQSPLYGEWEYTTREVAWSLAHELPGPVELPPEQLREEGSMSDSDIASVARLTLTFIGNLSGLVLHISLAKIALEGGNRRKAKPEQPAATKPPSTKPPSGKPKPAPDKPERVA